MWKEKEVVHETNFLGKMKAFSFRFRGREAIQKLEWFDASLQMIPLSIVQYACQGDKNA